MNNNNQFTRRLLPKILFFLFVAALGGSYLYFTWVSIKKEQRENVLQIGRSVGAMISKTDLLALQAKPEDIDKPEYTVIKNNLKAITKVNPKARFAYLYTEQNGKIFFIADSEPEESEDYSPPGQEFTEAQPQDKQPLIDGNETVTSPSSDRWGTWVSVLIPIKDDVTGRIIAVFGIDYDASSLRILVYRALLKSSLIILLLFLALYFVFRIQSKNKSLNIEISEREKADEALINSETRMQSITDSAQDAILMMDAKGRISYWNPAAERIFGYTNEEAVGQNLHKLIAPQNYYKAFASAFPEFSKTGQGSAIGKTIDFEALRKDGMEISIQLSLSSLKIKGEWNAVGVLRDISEQKKTEAALLKAKEESEMANKAKSIFLSNMSHEIRTPLNAIIGFSQLMNRDRQLSEVQKEYNVSIINAGEHLLELINEILELSKIEAGRTKLNPSNINLHNLSEDIHMLFREKAKAKHLQLIFETAEDLPRFVIVDEGKLRQIFVNIIGNAIKFTDEGGVAVRIRVDRKTVDKWNLIVEIQDSGPGISVNELGRLFRHFEQTSSGVKKGSGTGLGLALSKELAVLMGGDISVTSEVNKGSVFTFWVEIKEGRIEEDERNTPKQVIGIEKGEEKYRILVVDDKIDNLKVVVSLLRLVGFDTNEAVNGEDAIAKFIEYKPHLILMDMRMPVMDGYEATRRIKSMENGDNTPIIALTASTFEEERNRIASLRMQGYIRKPFRENELFSTIEKVLGIKYIYNDGAPLTQSNEIIDDGEVSGEIAKLPENMVSEMLEAVSVADLDLLIKLIDRVDSSNSELAQYLRTLAMNYDYEHIKYILTKKG
jgi:PAS domain S-box-containing protein